MNSARRLWCCICIFFLSVSAYKELSDDALQRMAALSPIDSFKVDGERLKPLLVPRVAGTPENAIVRQFIVDHFEKLNWQVEQDAFSDSTPMGEKQFVNVIATHRPNATRRLVLAAHYDSKYYADFEFIGATDSAVPCAVLMDIGQTINDVLTDNDDDVTLQMVFFDGEEAFKQWTDTDSIYGARHLAEKWEAAYVQPAIHTVRHETELTGVDVLVLLDLLGTPNPAIHDYYRETSSLFASLARLESRLSEHHLLETMSTKDDQALQPIFNTNSYMKYQGKMLLDDHVPFLHRGVNILHVIPYPFPSVWHNQRDNADCIDPPTVRNLATLFRGFVLEYLELSIE